VAAKQLGVEVEAEAEVVVVVEEEVALGLWGNFLPHQIEFA